MIGPSGKSFSPFFFAPRLTLCWAYLMPWQENFAEGRRYTFKGGYFETRAAVRSGGGAWEGCPDMFGCSPGAGLYK